jgi:hypothetical protein
MAARNSIHARLSAFAAALLLSLAGCGGDQDSPSTGEWSRAGDSRLLEVTESRISGSVGDGPIIGAHIVARARSGEVLAEFTSTDTANYSMLIKTQGKNYPVTIEADQGIDLVTSAPPDFSLLSAILRPAKQTVVNLNPFATLVFGAANSNGGINDSSVAAASSAVMSHYSFGLDSAFVTDPVSTPIDNSNVHYFIKASETLGEMIRRSRDALYMAGSSRDGNGIVAALAADLSDGFIDGRGVPGHDARVAAVANVASAAVLVQAMANRLHVYGFDATGAMDNAIRQIRPSAPSSSNTANVRIPAVAFTQAIRALSTAAVMVDDARIGSAIDMMLSVAPGSFPATVASLLPAGIDDVLDEAVYLAAFASDAQIEAINAIARGASTATRTSEPTQSGNSAPVISGSPNTVLAAGTSWSFQPTASDPDGDRLSFAIVGKPGWAQFDTATGRLRGTPANAGEYGPISISVSDGQTTTALPAFILYVNAPTLGSATVSWVPPTERTDGSTLTDLAGYKLYYGTSAGNLDRIMNITNVGQTSQLVENLDAGTWYFAVTAYCSGGLESDKSSLGSKTIN